MPPKRARSPGTAGQRQTRRRMPGLTQEQLASRRQKEQTAKAMIGLRVRICPRVQRQKQGVPSGVLEIREVTRREEKLGFTLVGKDVRGAPITYKDWFPMEIDISERYKRTNEADAARFDPENYQEFFRSSLGASKRAEEEVYGLTAEPLRAVMPHFQFENPNIEGQTIRRNGNGKKADLAALLASDCTPFHATNGEEETVVAQNIWRATTGDGRRYDTESEHLRKKACELLHVRYTRDDVTSERCPIPDELRTVGGTNIHPWQAQLYAEFQEMMRNRTAAQTILMTRQRGGYGCVQGLAKRPEALTVYVAEPGEGKTRIASLCAFDRSTLVVAPEGTTKHWKKEAGMVGVPAFQIGAGGKSVAEGVRLATASPKQMWIMTRPSVQRLANQGKLGALPEPELVIVDEFHLPFSCLQQLYNQWPRVVVIGLSGTFHRAKVVETARAIGWDEDMLEAAVVRVPRKAKRPHVDVHVKKVQFSRLEEACYEAGKAWMTSAEKQRLLIFSPPDIRSGAEEYRADLWSGIVGQLQEADQEVHRRLSRLLKHVFLPERRSAVLEKIAEEMGKEAAETIRVASEALPDVATSYGPSEVRAHLTEALRRRTTVLGSYSFLVRQLDTVSAASEIDCPVCMDKTRAWSIAAPCGHLVCVECSAQPVVQERCPTCRAARPAWKDAAAVARLREESTPANVDEPGDAARLDTSSKLKGLASILLFLKSCERALVVCPGRDLIEAVAKEMGRVGIKLGKMTGSNADQERTLLAWRSGRKAYKGLLCLPSIHGVDLPEATTIVFLTPTIPTDEYLQALARVVRQGNDSVEKGVPVKVWFVVYRGTEEDDPQVLDAKVDLAKSLASQKQRPASAA